MNTDHDGSADRTAPQGRGERCAEFTRDRAELAEHLASDPTCASWAKRSTGLDRLWEATRPPEPPVAVWETLWARVNQGAEAAQEDRPAPAGWPTRPVAWILVAAQAAALLVAGLLVIRSHDSGSPSPTQTPHLASAPASRGLAVAQGFQARPEETLILHLKDWQVQEVDRLPVEGISETDTVPWVHDLYNGMEALGVESVASTMAP